MAKRFRYRDTEVSWYRYKLKSLLTRSGNPPNACGKAKEMFGKKGYDGVAACQALHSVIKANAIETLISSFISPLPLLADESDRVHCSLNLNTETGRLSARKPNLQVCHAEKQNTDFFQNQPAHDKDIYKIRKAFTCEPGKQLYSPLPNQLGNTLIVADYGQLELRLLAHVTNCKSMIEAFKSGGDFHSRTAVGMYPEIQQAIKEGTSFPVPITYAQSVYFLNGIQKKELRLFLWSKMRMALKENELRL